MTEVFRLCDDYITRWAALDPVSAGMVGLSGVFGAATDYATKRGPDQARPDLVAARRAGRRGQVPDLVRALHRLPRGGAVRYLGWPGQAISYKLGERGWLAAREQAMRRPGPGEFDLKRWHTAALSLGPIGLDAL